MTTCLVVAAGTASYLLGAVPFGYLVARAHGVNIRQVGSGNIGATNVLRAIGKGPGILTFACDVLKGFLAAFALPLLVARWTGSNDRTGVALLCMFCVVAGHNWPVFLNFKGGKGVATSTGALLGLAPLAVAVGFVAWLLLFLPLRIVSVASMGAALVAAVAAWVLHIVTEAPSPLLPVALTVLAAAAIWRHKSNIRRLLNGTEGRFEFRRKGKEQEPTANG